MTDQTEQEFLWLPDSILPCFTVIVVRACRTWFPATQCLRVTHRNTVVQRPKSVFDTHEAVAQCARDEPKTNTMNVAKQFRTPTASSESHLKSRYV